LTLQKYREKRRFERTPEPKGKTHAGRGALRFVVQKHQASRLHYDFRLEMDGVMKSWAVPKGPSLRPGEKRLGVMVEDHPLDYRKFEGTIPQGNYGAGTVMVWDRGTYEVLDETGQPVKGRGKSFRGDLEKGHLRVVLHGQKLRGEFSLVKLRRDKGNNWLLLKRGDEYASDADILEQDRSVVSQRSMEDIAEGISRPVRKSKERAERKPAAADGRRRAGRTPASFKSVNLPSLPTGDFTNLEKVYWPDDGYTKGDVLRYYHEVATWILPHLRDRPMSLNRHPNGIAAKNFFQKDVSRQPPPGWVRTQAIASEADGKEIRYVVCQDEATLLYVANLGCIEMNPWNSRIGSLDNPDYLIIDLDPQDVPFSRTMEAAQEVRKLLEGAGVDSYCKTSGKRGLHVCVPLGARYPYEQVRQFAEIVARLTHAKLPATTSVVRSPGQRRGRVYIDFLQNSRGQTMAAPYSLRPVPGAPVSTPLNWREVGPKLVPARFTIETIRRRLDRVGDLWQHLLGPGMKLDVALRALRAEYEGSESTESVTR
jgi:bifunctional non-homologous end joining protein LigD